MAFRAAVITFPGSNCDRDMAVAIERISGTAPIRVWHGDAHLPDDLDFIALPGGFSYGDYLRSGAIAAIGSTFCASSQPKIRWWRAPFSPANRPKNRNTSPSPTP